MRFRSKKTAARERECVEFRRALVARVGRCECCGFDPQRVRPGMIRWEIRCHEIARGVHRQKALDKRYAILVVCPPCHDDVDGWSEARQLAVLRRSRPQDFDLDAYNALIGWGKYRIALRDVEEAAKEAL